MGATLFPGSIARLWLQQCHEAANPCCSSNLLFAARCQRNVAPVCWRALQVNPRGLVPAVEHKGVVHVESLDICR